MWSMRNTPTQQSCLCECVNRIEEKAAAGSWKQLPAAAFLRILLFGSDSYLLSSLSAALCTISRTFFKADGTGAPIAVAFSKMLSNFVVVYQVGNTGVTSALWLEIL